MNAWVWCCEDLQDQTEQFCVLHGDECPDLVVIRRSNGRGFGLPIRDGSGSFIVIGFCPWCGSALPVEHGPDEDDD